MNETIKGLLLKNSYIRKIYNQNKQIKECKQNIKSLKKEIKMLRKDIEYKIESIASEDKYEELLKLWYRENKGSVLDLSNPKTLDDKIQWLKLNRNSKRRSELADKLKVREFVENTIGDDYLVPLLGVYNHPEDIPFEDLPDSFVIKANHGCGYNLIVKDKELIDVNEAKNELNVWMSENYAFKNGFELQYKDIARKLIVEQYIEDSEGALNDYKFYCFGAHVECVVVCIDRATNKSFYLFDRNWELLRYNKKGKAAPKGFSLPKPKGLDEMFKIAGRLSEASGEPFVRVDLYNCDEHIYFGEMTFTPASGVDKNRSEEADIYFGELLDIDNLV